MHVWGKSIEKFHTVVSRFLSFPISMDIVAGALIINEFIHIARTIKTETIGVPLLFYTMSTISLR